MSGFGAGGRNQFSAFGSDDLYNFGGASSLLGGRLNGNNTGLRARGSSLLGQNSGGYSQGRNSMGHSGLQISRGLGRGGAANVNHQYSMGSGNNAYKRGFSDYRNASSSSYNGNSFSNNNNGGLGRLGGGNPFDQAKSLLMEDSNMFVPQSRQHQHYPFHESSRMMGSQPRPQHQQRFGGYGGGNYFADDYEQCDPGMGFFNRFEGRDRQNYYEPFEGPEFNQRGSNFTPGFFGGDRGMKRRRSDLGNGVYGYLAVHNLRAGRSPMFIISYLNSVLRGQLRVNGLPVKFSKLLNDSTLEVIFPSMEVLRVIVEKYSPIMIKNSTIYVTHKPPIANYTNNVPPHRRLQQRVTYPTGNKKPVGTAVVHYLNRRNITPVLSAEAAAAAAAKRNLRKNRVKAPRLRGVFPDGVQPSSLVLVVDDLCPFVSLTLLQRTHEEQVLTGSALDTAGFLEVIHSDANLTKDGVMYVIVPSLAFFFKNLHGLSSAGFATGETEADSMETEEASTTTAAAAGGGKVIKKVTAPASGSVKKSATLLQLLLNDFPSLVSTLDQEYLGKPVPVPDKKNINDPNSAAAAAAAADDPATLNVTIADIKAFSTAPIAKDCNLVSKLLTRHLLHSALQLRAAVRASSTNCEVVYCGYPAYYMDGDALAGILASKMSLGRAKIVSEAMITAMKTFNDYAANTWTLGGFKINNFNDDNLPSVFTRTVFTPANTTTTSDGDAGDASTTTEAASAAKEGTTTAAAAAPTKTTHQVASVEDVYDDVMRSYSIGGGGVGGGDDVDDDDGSMFSLDSLLGSSGGVLRESCDRSVVMAGYTANILCAVRRVLNFQLHKGGFVPWGPIEAEEFDESVLPDIVKESLATDIYTQDEDAQGGAGGGGGGYYCTLCDEALRDLREADSHAYTRAHANAVRRTVQKKSKEGGSKKSVLINTLPAVVSVPLAKDYLRKMANFRLVALKPAETVAVGGKTPKKNNNIAITDVDPSEARYKCMVCDIPKNNNYDATSLRFHVHHHRHHISVNAAFGVTNHTAVVLQHENWPLVQSMLRHPPLDVILLADSMHSNTLGPITQISDKIHAVTIPSLLQQLDTAAAAETVVEEAIAEALHATQGRPALWLLVAGADLLDLMQEEELEEDAADQDQKPHPQHVNKLVTPMLQLQALLKLKLPSDQCVVTAPLLPLNLIHEDQEQQSSATSLTEAQIAQLKQTTNSYVVFEKQMQSVAKTYHALHYRFLHLHRGSALHSNVYPIHSRVLTKGTVVKTITCVDNLPSILTTSWHIAVQSLATAATYALPAVFLRPREECGTTKEVFELDSKIQNIKVVGEVRCKNNSPFSSATEINVDRKLAFDDSDIEFLVSKATASKDGEFTVWYLSCPFPDVLFDRFDIECCSESHCAPKLYTWKYKGPNALQTSALQMSRFLLELQSKMPAGNVVTLLPLFPSTMVTYSATDAVTHSALHTVHQQQPNVYFTTDLDPTIKPVMAAFEQLWLDLFLKTNVHYTVGFEREFFSHVDVQEINQALTSLKEEAKVHATNWRDTFNYILKMYSTRQKVELSDAISTQLGIPVVGVIPKTKKQRGASAPTTTAASAAV